MIRIDLVSIWVVTTIVAIFTIINPTFNYVVKSKFNKLRYITLRDDAFCEAYQEFKDNQCVAKLTECSPLDDEQILKMRQLLCGPKFNIELQPPPHILPPPPTPEELHNQTGAPFLIPDFPPPYFMDVHPAQPHSFPWLAAIYNPDRRFICTGALVAPKTVVTSAQCVSGQSPSTGSGGGGGGAGGSESGEQQKAKQTMANFFVRFGRHHLNVSNPYDKAYEYDVETIEVAQQYDRNTLENDFAILKLVSPVCNISPVTLPKKDDWENGHFFGNMAPVIYAGWGLGHFQKPYLRSLTSHLMTKDLCSDKFNWPHDQLSSNHLCVAPPINVCVGGVGTPLVAYTKHREVLLGTMTMGEHCNTAKLPLVFTKVSTYLDEIDRFVEEDFKSTNGTLGVECFQPKPHLQQQPYHYYPAHYPDQYGNYQIHQQNHESLPIGHGQHDQHGHEIHHHHDHLQHHNVLLDPTIHLAKVPILAPPPPFKA
ncbi:hypothetical protein BLOT_011926 [Blomia tropicalis]|nr:hypothetical protein BLOT_011926 [Blomia tropicalis]